MGTPIPPDPTPGHAPAPAPGRAPERRPRPARRSFAVAGIIVGITLLLARCSPAVTTASAPLLPLPGALGKGGPAEAGTPEKLPANQDAPPGEQPADDGGARSTTDDTKGNGSPPPSDPERGGSKGTTTTASRAPAASEASFCRFLGMFTHPIRELHGDGAGAIPVELADEVERLSAGFRDDPDFDLHGGAEDMLVIWRWAVSACTQQMAGQPPRFRLVQFEDQLAGLGPIDVCATLSAGEVEAAFSGVADAEVTSSKASATTYANRCAYEVSIGARSPVELRVSVDDRWGILDGNCIGRDGGGEVTLSPAERACLVSSAMNGSWQLYLEQRSRTVSIELRWPVRDARPPSTDAGRQVVERLYASIAPAVVPGKEGER